jgi:cytochrome c peroxidase
MQGGRIFSALLMAVVFCCVALAQSRVGSLGSMVQSRYDFGQPDWLPLPLEPEGNRTTPAKVELGRRLFYDPRLSRDGTISCASCHKQSLAFTDGQSISLGVSGEATPRNSMSLANVGYIPFLTWANPLLHGLEQQALVPLTSQSPVEMGIAGMEAQVMERLRAEPIYRELFPKSFPEAGGEISLATVVRALAAFQRTLISVNSYYDRHLRGGTRLGEAALRGEALFFGEKLECHHCHFGVHLSAPVVHERAPVPEQGYHNTGLYNLDGKGAYPADNTGIAEVTGRAQDMGRFRAPSLRNIAVTAPYMHDGSILTLDEVIDHYAAGGRTIKSGPHAGVGARNPLKSSFVPGFSLTPQERADLKAFLHSLTDHWFLSDPRFSDPWKGGKASARQ